MERIKHVSSFLFGDSKSTAVDTQKLKADIDSAYSIIEGFLNLKYELTKEGICISCHYCSKRQKIDNPKNALFVATYQDSSTHIKGSIHTHKGAGQKQSQNDSSVDRSLHKFSRGNQVNTLPYPRETQGDDSDDDAKTDETADKFEKEKQIINDKLSEKEKCLREAKEENSELQKQLNELERKYNRDLQNAGIEQSRLTEEKNRGEKSIKEIQSKLEQLKFEVSRLKTELEEKGKECRYYQSCLDSDKQRHENIISQMNTEQDNLRSQLKKASDLIENLKSKNSDLAKECHEKEEEIRDVTIQLSNKSQECRDKERQYHLLEKKMKESQADNVSKADRIEKLENEMQNLHRTKRQKEEEIGTLNKEIENHHRIRKEKDEEIGLLDDKITDLLSENNTKDKQIDFVSSELRTMQRMVEDERKTYKSVKASLEDEILGLKADLTAWEERTKKTLAINFHTSLKQSLALPARQHIERCLKERCQSDKVTLEVKQYKSPDTTPGPILVLCMNVSRLGTDVKEALKGTPGNFEVLVVVLHHKEVHALPSQASDRVLTGEEYKQLGAIVDAAFWTGKGMYDCELNKLATEKIYNFVSGFVSK